MQTDSNLFVGHVWFYSGNRRYHSV